MLVQMGKISKIYQLTESSVIFKEMTMPPSNILFIFYCIEGIEMRQLGFKVRRLFFLNRY
jgi:hypothetical protein